MCQGGLVEAKPAETDAESPTEALESRDEDPPHWVAEGFNASEV